jgi:hypothetical protein
LQSSSNTNGDSVDWFDYSVDGGTTWKGGIPNGMKVNGRLSDTVSTLWNTYQGDVNWGLVTVDLSADNTVNNNPNFVLRIRFRGGDNHTSGNNRLDNMTFEGIGGGGKLPSVITIKQPGNNILVAGRHATVSFDTLNGVGASKTIEYSTDGGTTWASVGTTTSNTYDWVVPSTPSTSGKLRVKDAEGTVGVSSPFVIVNIDPKTNRIVHYWDFNNLTKTYSNPNIPAFSTDFSANPSAQGSIVYTRIAGTSSTYAGYIDPVAGDLGNVQFGVAAGNALRVRNPVDSIELHFIIPTTGFKNIGFNYVIEESSNISPLTRKFDYSTDGGTTWITTGLSITTESNLDSTKFDPVAITFAGGSAAENNANLVFRIKMSGGLSSGTSGNNRYDNITVTGDPIINAVGDHSTSAPVCAIYPNPAHDLTIVSAPFDGVKTISVSDVTGHEVISTSDDAMNIGLNISNLSAGMYFVRVYDETHRLVGSLKFVKQ